MIYIRTRIGSGRSTRNLAVMGPGLAFASPSSLAASFSPSSHQLQLTTIMLSLRAFSRAAPRFSRSVARSSLRPVALPKPAFQSWKQVSKPAYASFSTSRAFREPAAESK